MKGAKSFLILIIIRNNIRVINYILKLSVAVLLVHLFFADLSQNIDEDFLLFQFITKWTLWISITLYYSTKIKSEMKRKSNNKTVYTQKTKKELLVKSRVINKYKNNE